MGLSVFLLFDFGCSAIELAVTISVFSYSISKHRFIFDNCKRLVYAYAIKKNTKMKNIYIQYFEAAPKKFDAFICTKFAIQIAFSCRINWEIFLLASLMGSSSLLQGCREKFWTKDNLIVAPFCN